MPFDNRSMISWTSLSASCAAFALSGCTMFTTPSGVSFASDPTGARVIVDKKDSGFVTPCKLDLGSGSDVRIDLQFPGYTTATRYLTPDRHVYAILWSDMYASVGVWHFPLWLNLKDFFTPVKIDSTLSPGRVYVRLERASDP